MKIIYTVTSAAYAALAVYCFSNVPDLKTGWPLIFLGSLCTVLCTERLFRVL